MDSDDAARIAYRRMQSDSVRSLVVVKGEQYVGIVEWRTIRNLESAELAQPVENFIDPTVPTLDASMSVADAMAVFDATEVATLGLLPVVDANGRLVGQIEREEFQGRMEDVSGGITVQEDPLAHLLTGPDVPRTGAHVISSDGEKLGTFVRHVEDRGKPRWIEVEHGHWRRKHTRYVPLLSIARQSPNEIVLNIDAATWSTFRDRPVEEKLSGA
jgi:hypothetical protein